MAAKKRELSFPEIIRKIQKAGLGKISVNTIKQESDSLSPVEDRIENVLGIVKRANKQRNKMIYFIMYDIENDKVRTQIAKYLIKKGCSRVQKSIFLANTDRKEYDEIRSDLKEVQECYENNDSILIVPVSTDEIKAMKVIGKNVDFDLILQSKSTLFF